MKPGHGRVDYLLYVDRAVVGVIEAKPQGTPLSGVEWQSAMYAEGLPPDLRLKALTKDGRLPFVFGACLWRIVTETGSIYLLDLEQRLLTRVPELGAMRRDHVPLHVHQLIEARVGDTGRFLVQVRDNEIPTLRLTSHILEIQQIRQRRYSSH